jgi:hypothetical protein
MFEVEIWRKNRIVNMIYFHDFTEARRWMSWYRDVDPTRTSNEYAKGPWPTYERE